MADTGTPSGECSQSIYHQSNTLSMQAEVVLSRFRDQRSFKLRGRYLVDGGPRNYIIPNFDSIFGFEVGLGLDNSIFVK